MKFFTCTNLRRKKNAALAAIFLLTHSVLPSPCQCFNPMKMKRNCWVIFA